MVQPQLFSTYKKINWNLASTVLRPVYVVIRAHEKQKMQLKYNSYDEPIYEFKGTFLISFT